MKKELWVNIPGYDGFMASDKGRIKTIERIINYGDRFCLRKGKILKPHLSKVGYYTVAPFQKTTTVHVLIALSFHGSRPKNSVIDHINGNKLDNRPVNLRYTTYSGNMQNALRLGAIPTGIKCSWSKLTVEEVLKIRDDKRTYKEIGKSFGVSRQTVGEIKKFLIWKQV